MTPTLRTLGGHVLWVICNACQHAVEADQPALIAAGRGDAPLVDLRFWCGGTGLPRSPTAITYLTRRTVTCVGTPVVPGEV